MSGNPQDKSQKPKTLPVISQTNSGQIPLAAITEKIYSLSTSEEELESIYSKEQMLFSVKEPIHLCPPIPIYQTENNWPLLTVSKGFFDTTLLSRSNNQKNISLTPQENVAVADGWESEEDEVESNIKATLEGESGRDVAEEKCNSAGWDVEDVDIAIELETDETALMSEEYFSPPIKGVPINLDWINQSRLAIDHILAGSYDSAFRLLHEQIGIVKFDDYKSLFLSLYACSRTSFNSFPNILPLHSYPLRNWKEVSPKTYLPAIVLRLPELVQRLQISYQLTTGGRFSEAIEKMQTILHAIPLLVLDSKQDIAEAQQLINICREYVLGLKMEIERKNQPKSTHSEQRRNCEMVAYFTHCQLQPIHQILTLRTAVNTFFKFKNYKTARSFARRLLELGPKPEVSQQIRKILQVCDSNPTDEHQLEYDEYNPFSICAFSFKPIYKGKPECHCPFCNVSYQVNYKNQICNVCEVAQIGKDCTGLKLSLSQSR